MLGMKQMSAAAPAHLRPVNAPQHRWTERLRCLVCPCDWSTHYPVYPCSWSTRTPRHTPCDCRSNMAVLSEGQGKTHPPWLHVGRCGSMERFDLGCGPSVRPLGTLRRLVANGPSVVPGLTSSRARTSTYRISDEEIGRAKGGTIDGASSRKATTTRKSTRVNVHIVHNVPMNGLAIGVSR